MVSIPDETGQVSQVVANEGMSLRDWFAGKAMASFLQGGDPTRNMFLDSPRGRTLDAWVAGAAYDYADAMLAARKEGA